MLETTAQGVYEKYEAPEERFHRIDVRHPGPFFNWRQYCIQLDAYAADLEQKLRMSGNRGFIEQAQTYTREWDRMCIGRGHERVKHMQEIQELENVIARKDMEIEKLNYRLTLYTTPKEQIQTDQARNPDNTYTNESGRTGQQQVELAYLMSLEYGGPYRCEQWQYIGNLLDLRPKTAQDYARKFYKNKCLELRNGTCTFHVDIGPYRSMLGGAYDEDTDDYPEEYR